jgi:nucleoside-diphosphate-sugar epimerase
MHRAGSSTLVLSQLAAEHDKLVTLVTGDITDRTSLVAAMPQGVGVVFHVAAGLGMWVHQRESNYQTNVLGTRNVVDVALQKNAGKLVHTSTIAVFLPAANDSLVDETFTHTGRNHWASYPSTKELAEDEVRAGIADGLWATILNPAAIFGSTATPAFGGFFFLRSAHPTLTAGKYDTTSFGQFVRLVKDQKIPGRKVLS